MQSFQAWALDVVGLVFKVAKDRVAARRQLALGFVWDSTTLTRTIEERKLAGYLDLLLEYATVTTLGLAQMQSMAGKLHRMILTLPPGAHCLAVSLFELMSGLRYQVVLAKDPSYFPKTQPGPFTLSPNPSIL